MEVPPQLPSSQPGTREEPPKRCSQTSPGLSLPALGLGRLRLSSARIETVEEMLLPLASRVRCWRTCTRSFLFKMRDKHLSINYTTLTYYHSSTTSSTLIPYHTLTILKRNNHLLCRHALLLKIKSSLHVLQALPYNMWIWSGDICTLF